MWRQSLFQIARPCRTLAQKNGRGGGSCVGTAHVVPERLPSGSQDILESILRDYRKVFQINPKIILKFKMFPQREAREGSRESAPAARRRGLHAAPLFHEAPWPLTPPVFQNARPKNGGGGGSGVGTANKLLRGRQDVLARTANFKRAVENHS